MLILSHQRRPCSVATCTFSLLVVSGFPRHTSPFRSSSIVFNFGVPFSRYSSKPKPFTDTTCIRLFCDSQREEVSFSCGKFEVFHLKRTVDSTQEEVRRLLEKRSSQTTGGLLAVIADNQQKGRGTNGRSWVASHGNLYLTFAISFDLIPLSKLTLLPLCVGILIAERLGEHSAIVPTLKWPNDVLIDGRKIAGTLIENHRVDQQDWWLVGIGINVNSHPQALPSEKCDFRSEPRSATCLRQHAKGPIIPTALELGTDIASDLIEWIHILRNEEALSIVSKWKSWANLTGTSTYILRETGESVSILDVEVDGQLRVLGANGAERLLIADYFY